MFKIIKKIIKIIKKIIINFVLQIGQFQIAAIDWREEII